MPSKLYLESLLTLAMAWLSAFSLTYAIQSMTRSDSDAGLLGFALFTAIVVVVGWFAARRVTFFQGAIAAVLVVFAAACWPLLVNVVDYLRGGYGRPAEQLGFDVFRNLVLALAIFTHGSVIRNIAAGTSAFGILFAVSAGEGSTLIYLLAIYIAVASIWLMLWYRRRLDTSVLTISESQLPILPAVVVIAVALGVVGRISGFSFLPGRVLAELVGSSGGTTDSHPEAQGGVNAGEDIVSGAENAETDGGDGELYIDSPEPSLYDVMNELYGEPYKPTEMQRAIALDPNQIREPDHVSKNHQARREFSLFRRRRKSTQHGPDQVANALCYVYGKAPAHLPMLTFDAFDGSVWQQTNAKHEQPIKQFRGAWMQITDVGIGEPNYLAASTRHRIKIGKLESRAIPAPPHTEYFRVGGVNRENMFAWLQQDIVGLQDPDGKIPSGEHVETEAYTVDWSRLTDVSFPELAVYALPPFRSSLHNQTNFDRKLDALVELWTESVPRGWPQVEAITSRLRRDYKLSPDYVVPGDCENPVDHFLFESRRGPDYLFASAAALLLRRANHATRLVSGLYVNPDRYDPESKAISVTTSDVHFWVEVGLPDQRWVTAEPTPGYGLTAPEKSWWQKVVDVANALYAVVHNNKIAVGSILLVGMTCLAFRKAVWEELLWVSWLLCARGSPNRVCGWTLWLLDRRAQLVGKGRIPCRSPQRWYTNLIGDAQTEDATVLREFLTLHHQIRFKSVSNQSIERSASEICRRLVQVWTTGTIRRQHVEGN